jgi:predicted nucleotidyltransferase
MDFEDAWNGKKVALIGDVAVNFVGLEHLILLKKIAGRPQDLADLHKLIKRKKK